MTDLEFIGITATQRVDTSAPAGTGGMATHTEVGRAVGPLVNKEFAAELALAHEASGFDRVLIAHSSASIDGFVLADQTLEATTTLKVLLAHRPGFWAPTIAARAYATLDAFHPGRVAMHVITGGDDADQQRDGDYLTKEERYRRTDDFLTVVRQEWESETPFDHEGEFYKVTGAWSSVRPPKDQAQPTIPIYFGGASEDAIRVGGKHADAYAFWGEPLDGIRQRIVEVQAAAAPYGRNPRFSVSLRPIVAETEEEAWAQAEAILAAAQAKAAANGGGPLSARKRIAARTPWGRTGWSRPPRRPTSTTSGSGPRWPRSPVAPATPPRSSAPTSRWPRGSSTTSTSASPRSSSAASTRSRTPRSTAV